MNVEINSKFRIESSLKVGEEVIITSASTNKNKYEVTITRILYTLKDVNDSTKIVVVNITGNDGIISGSLLYTHNNKTLTKLAIGFATMKINNIVLGFYATFTNIDKPITIKG